MVVWKPFLYVTHHNKDVFIWSFLRYYETWACELRLLGSRCLDLCVCVCVCAVSIVNSSKMSHSLWLISLCLSWILLPVFEALQWADDCLGRDYYTNLSTLLCQAFSSGRAHTRVYVCVWVSLHFHYTRQNVCLYAPPWECILSMLYVCAVYTFCVYAAYVWLCEFNYSNLLLPWRPHLPSTDIVSGTDTALHAGKPETFALQKFCVCIYAHVNQL